MTELITDNSDGSSAHGSDDLADDTGLLICQGISLIVFVLSLAIYACL